MNPTVFYLLFIPGLTLAVVGGSFAYMSFAMTQGEFQRSTRWGLLSLTVVLAVVAILFFAALQLDRPHLPHAT